MSETYVARLERERAAPGRDRQDPPGAVAWVAAGSLQGKRP